MHNNIATVKLEYFQNNLINLSSCDLLSSEHIWELLVESFTNPAGTFIIKHK